MIRLARELLNKIHSAIVCGVMPNRDEATLFTEYADTLFDAAEVAIADDYEPPPVVVDTREQRPFAPYLWQKGKREYLPPERQCLEEGDYTTPALRDHVRIERKSIPDLYGSLFGTSCDAMGESAPNLERLRKEFLRLRYYPRAYFIIEGMPRELVDYIRDKERRVDPVAAVQLVESLGFDYAPEEKPCPKTGKRIYGVTLRWCPSRDSAEWFVGYILSRGHAQATNKTDAKKARKRGLDLPWLWVDEKRTQGATPEVTP